MIMKFVILSKFNYKRDENLYLTLLKCNFDHADEKLNYESLTPR